MFLTVLNICIGQKLEKNSNGRNTRYIELIMLDVRRRCGSITHQATEVFCCGLVAAEYVMTY